MSNREDPRAPRRSHPGVPSKSVTRLCAAAGMMLCAAGASISADTINAFAGTGSSGYTGDGGQAKSAKLKNPCGVGVDSKGHVYVADSENKVVRKIDITTGVITTFAGGGSSNIGEGAFATSARLRKPSKTFVDASGNMYIADRDHNRIRRVNSSTGTIDTIAGTGAKGYSGDGGSGTSAVLNHPEGIVVDSAGNVYFADTDNHVIRKITPAGVISTISGNGSAGDSGDGGPASSGKLHHPSGMAIDGSGNIYIADSDNHRIRKITAATNIITTVAGSGSSGSSGDGGLATSAKLHKPQGVWVTSAGDLYIADYDNHKVRKVDAVSGNISTVAGSGVKGFAGDGGAATSAKMDHLEGVAVASNGDIYIADKHNNRIRKVSASDGKISTYAGTGAKGFSGDGGPATSAQLKNPVGVFVTSTGDVYVTDKDNHAVRKINGATGIITTVAGGIGPYGDGGPAVNIALGKMEDVTVGRNDYLYIADTEQNLVRKVNVNTGIIYSVMGYGESLDQESPTDDITLEDPSAVAVDDDGNVYVAERAADRSDVYKYTESTGVYERIAGTGSEGYSGDGGLATSAKLRKPQGIAVDRAGNIYIADTENHRIRKINATTGIITTVAGNGSDGNDGNGGAATSAKVGKPTQVEVDYGGRLFISQAERHVVRMVDRAGTISIVAGTGSAGNSGDGADALLAKLNTPFGIGFKRRGISPLYITDRDDHRTRVVNMPVNSMLIKSWREVINKGS